MTEANQNPLYKAAGFTIHASFSDLRRGARSVIDRQVDMRRGFYDRNHVPVISGQARFIDPHTIEVQQSHGAKRTFTAEGFVLATGSRPHRPADIDFTHPRIFDSDTVLGLEETPQSITIYGAGVIEVANIRLMFRKHGMQGQPGQHPLEAARVSRRRNHRRPVLPTDAHDLGSARAAQ